MNVNGIGHVCPVEKQRLANVHRGLECVLPLLCNLLFSSSRYLSIGIEAAEAKKKARKYVAGDLVLYNGRTGKITFKKFYRQQEHKETAGI